MRLPLRLRLWLDRLIINLYPPFLFTGTRCVHVTPDYRTARMRLAKSFLTRNMYGAQFGGAIFAMADPVHALLLHRILGSRYQIWNKASRIEFRRPGRTALSAEFQVTDRDLQTIEAALAADDRAVHPFRIEIKDTGDETVAVVEVELYARLMRK